MIYLYSGTPGSGKSLHTASVIYWRLKTKKPVIANFNINIDKIKNHRGDFLYITNDKLTPDFLINYARKYWNGRSVKEDEICVFIDECQLLFNAREWNMKGRDNWLSFFTQHRKYGFKIILVAQFDRMIDRQIRSLIEYEYIHRKVSNYGWRGWLLSFWSMGKLFVCIERWYPLKETVGREWFLAKKKYYSLYDTYNTFATVEEGVGGSPSDTVVDKLEKSDSV